jgi:hypothetical protein
MKFTLPILQFSKSFLALVRKIEGVGGAHLTWKEEISARAVALIIRCAHLPAMTPSFSEMSAFKRGDRGKLEYLSWLIDRLGQGLGHAPYSTLARSLLQSQPHGMGAVRFGSGRWGLSAL